MMEQGVIKQNNNNTKDIDNNNTEDIDNNSTKDIDNSEDNNKQPIPYEIDEKEPCPICLNDMQDDTNKLNDDGLAVLDNCKHIYHISCIKAWSDVTNTCPLCKARFTKLQVFNSHDNCTKYLNNNRVLDESMNFLREETVVNRDQHDTNDHFINLDEIYYEDDGVQCTDMCYLRNGAPFMDGFHFSVQCDTCQNWFHGCCVGFVSELDPPLIWHCNACQMNNSNNNNTTTTNNINNNDNTVDNNNNILPLLDNNDIVVDLTSTTTDEISQNDNKEPPRRNEPKTYGCDYRCGFIGTYNVVAEHEKTCSYKLKKQDPKPIRAKPRQKIQAPIEDFGKFSPDLCSICFDDANAIDQIIFCDRCNIGVHQSCYNIPKIPPDKWYCDTCNAGFQDPPKCIFCPNGGNFGAMRRTSDGRWAHSFCALWISEAGFLDNKKMEPICSIDKNNHRKGSLDRIPNNLFEEFCDVCGQKDGAVVHCSIPSCKFKFHPSCGKKEGFYMCIERLSGQNSEKIQLAAFCKKHTHKKRSSKLTGKDVEIWLPYEKRWSKARVGYFRPRDNIHTVAYHEDGVVEEIYDLENSIQLSKVSMDNASYGNTGSIYNNNNDKGEIKGGKHGEKKKKNPVGRPRKNPVGGNLVTNKKNPVGRPRKKRGADELMAINTMANAQNLKTIRLLDNFAPPPSIDPPSIGKKLPAYINKKHDYKFPDHSWQCNFCKAFNHEKRSICSRCCVDSRKWKDFFTQEKTHTFIPHKRRRRYWADEHFFKASWV